MLKDRLKLRNTHRFIALFFYYGLCRYLPSSMFPILGKTFKYLRYMCCKVIFAKCGHHVNVERGALFGCGFDIQIGNYSGIGINCVLPSNTIIGKNVNMGPNVYILARNHRFDEIDKPIQHQGYMPDKQTIIEDNVWIGRQVTFTPGRIVKKGSIIGACTLLCKDFPEFSIIGGNPSRLIRMRMGEN